jgi:rRNA maturation RNase YbeY
MSALITGPPSGLPAFDVDRFQERADAVLEAAGEPGAELSVALVDDAEIATLNEQYRDKEGPTDVLSFSLLEGDHVERRGGMLGDVVIAVPVADRQARELGHDLDEELLRLLIHGALHLLGFDHEEDEEARVMEAREREVRAGVLA